MVMVMMVIMTVVMMVRVMVTVLSSISKQYNATKPNITVEAGPVGKTLGFRALLSGPRGGRARLDREVGREAHSMGCPA